MPNLNVKHCKRDRSALQMLLGITLQFTVKYSTIHRLTENTSTKKNQKPGFAFHWAETYFSIRFLFINGSNNQLPSPQLIVKKHCPRSSSVLGKVCHLSYASLCHKQCSSSDSCFECLQVTTGLFTI